jgi:hypothetical protein
VPEALAVQVGRSGPSELEAPATFTAASSFAVRLVNHGRPIHVHLHPGATLAGVSSVEAGNYYLEREATVEIPVTVEETLAEPQSGPIEFVSGYGDATVQTEVTFEPPSASTVTVGETLAEPPQSSNRSSEGTFDNPAVPVGALGLVAAIIALLAVVFVQALAVVVGAVVVLISVVVAAILLFRRQKRD